MAERSDLDDDDATQVKGFEEKKEAGAGREPGKNRPINCNSVSEPRSS